MSIVFLSPTAQRGGSEAALLELLAGLRESHPSWSLDVVVASDGPLVGGVKALGVPVHVLPFPQSLARLGDWSVGRGVGARVGFMLRCAGLAWPAARYLHRLRAVLRDRRPNVIHTNGFKMHVLGALARPRGSAVLWHLHDYTARRVMMARLLRLIAHRCSTAVANSRSVADDMRSVCGPQFDVHPVWNAVDLNRFTPEGPQLDLDTLAGLERSEGVIRVGLVATFARWKGHRTFLDALALLAPSLRVRGYVIGGPVYETAGSQVTLEELRSVAASLGLGDRVGFTGLVADSAAAMRALDVVVHASTDPEPFGLVIAEAMACAKAVVTSGAGGARELTEPGVNALVHTPGDPRSLAQAIDMLVRDAHLRARLGSAARTSAEQRFTRRRLINEFTPIYERLATP
ncbi:MAG TPA: glycosyltransferase family 4 protein [Vicinamibacterales bacterium]|nr:glycosyltransferase family 4 protein [Vicinamibacterales bacterium]